MPEGDCPGVIVPNIRPPYWYRAWSKLPCSYRNALWIRASSPKWEAIPGRSLSSPVLYHWAIWNYESFIIFRSINQEEQCKVTQNQIIVIIQFLFKKIALKEYYKYGIFLHVYSTRVQRQSVQWTCTVPEWTVHVYSARVYSTVHMYIFWFWGLLSALIFILGAFLCPTTWSYEQNLDCAHLYNVISWTEMLLYSLIVGVLNYFLFCCFCPLRFLSFRAFVPWCFCPFGLLSVRLHDHMNRMLIGLTCISWSREQKWDCTPWLLEY